MGVKAAGYGSGTRHEGGSKWCGTCSFVKTGRRDRYPGLGNRALQAWTCTLQLLRNKADGALRDFAQSVNPYEPEVLYPSSYSVRSDSLHQCTSSYGFFGRAPQSSLTSDIAPSACKWVRQPRPANRNLSKLAVPAPKSSSLALSRVERQASVQPD